jgi:outer membrane protein OmpA-like peptidoglycan-associated protein
MRSFVRLTRFMLWPMLLASCSSPPKPPSIDESHRRPANTAMAVELQACKNDLVNSRLIASEWSQAARASNASLASFAARQQALADSRTDQAKRPEGNLVFTIGFAYGSTRVELAKDATRHLLDAAKAAPLVMLRGRTDGAIESAGESRIARQRAAAVQDYLVARGVDPSRVRATYQPIGDHAVANGDEPGRAQNRRVEIEVYQALPRASNLNPPGR